MSGSSAGNFELQKPADQKAAIEKFRELYTEVEKHLGVRIPTYIKYILFLSGFDNPIVLSTLSKNDIDILEKFSRSDMYFQDYKSSGKNWDMYYGNYSPLLPSEKFEIVPGHKRLLLCIADYFKQASKQKSKHP